MFKVRCHRCQFEREYPHFKEKTPTFTLKLAGWKQDDQYNWVCKKCLKASKTQLKEGKK